MTGVCILTVGPDEAEQRLDRWFRRRFPHIPQSRIEKMCRKGEIRVGGGRVGASARVCPGQRVRIPPLPDAGTAPRREGAAAPPRRAGSLRDSILFRDAHILVIDKPPGLAVQGGSKLTSHLAACLPALRFGRGEDPRLVHRLDKDTSGLLVLARTGAAAAKLAELFRSRSVEKIYFAVVAGRPHPSAGAIRCGLVKAGAPGDERMRPVPLGAVRGTGGAKDAVTEYRVIDRAAGRAAWVALRPATGRTHQLRAHMAAIGTPIAGDGKYGGKYGGGDSGRSANLGGEIARKLHLHAARLEFPHPATGRPVRFSAPLPEHMAETFALFGWTLDDAPDPLF